MERSNASPLLGTSEITFCKNVSAVGLPSTGKTLPSGASPVEEQRDSRVINGLTHLEDKEGLAEWVPSSLGLPGGRRS